MRRLTAECPAPPRDAHEPRPFPRVQGLRAVGNLPAGNAESLGQGRDLRSGLRSALLPVALNVPDVWTSLSSGVTEGRG